MKMERIKISIIVPIYNIKEFLPECVDSLVNQTLKDIEIILVDDGSTDGSSELCDLYAKKYSNIIAIHQKNQGQATARNNGVKIARGKYIQYVDGDDYITENACEALYNAAQKYDADIIRGDCLDHKRITSVDDQIISAIDYIKVALNENVYDIVTWLDIVKRELLVNRQIKFIEGCFYEDQQYMMNLLADKETSIVKISYPFYYYRMRSGSTTHSNDRKKGTDFIKILVEMRKMVEAYNPKDDYKICLENILSMGVWHFAQVWLRMNKKDREIYKQFKNKFEGYDFDSSKLTPIMQKRLFCFLHFPRIMLITISFRMFLKKAIKGFR